MGKVCYNLKMEDEDGNDYGEEIYRLTKENNRILRKMESERRRGLILRLLHWIVIIVLAVVAYLYIEPYIDRMEDLVSKVKEASTGAGEIIEQIPSVGNEQDI